MKLSRIMNVISTLFMLASPWVLYVTISQRRVGLAAAMLVGWVVVRTIPIVMTAPREHLMAALRLPAIGLFFALVGWISGSSVLLLVLPSATQAAFGLTFLRSLGGTPLVEHFARLVKAELSPAELGHCRTWTIIWGIYLLVLAALGLVLARWAPLKIWTIYTGFLNYALVGLLFAVEYVIRKYRFRDYGRNPADWVLSRLFPP